MAMENYGEFKHDHVSLYLICVFNMHYSPGVLEWGNKEWLAVHYGEFEEARGWVNLNNARVHYSESPTRVALQIPIMHS